MSRPLSANQGPKQIYLWNRSKDQIRNGILQDSLPSFQYRQNKYEDNFKEELNLLKNSWDELGITPEYRSVFINL